MRNNWRLQRYPHVRGVRTAGFGCFFSDRNAETEVTAGRGEVSAEVEDAEEGTEKDTEDEALRLRCMATLLLMDTTSDSSLSSTLAENKGGESR